MFPDRKRRLSSLAYFVQYPAGPVNMCMTVRLMTMTMMVVNTNMELDYPTLSNIYAIELSF